MQKSQSGDDFLKTYCGIDYSNGDTGLITGLETGVSETEINDANCVPESGKLNTKFKGNSFTKNNLTVTLGKFNDDGSIANRNFSELSDSEKFIWRGLYIWWVESALDLIAKSYGDNFSFTDKSSATVKEVYICFSDEVGASAYTNASYSSGLTKELYITFRHIPNIENDVDRANREFDRLVAHEFTHAVMYANVLGYPVCSSLPGFVIEGLADLTRGLENDSIKYYADKPSEFEKGLDVSKIGSYEDFMYAGGFTFFRYLARQASDFTVENETAKTTIQTFYGNDTINNTGSNVTITSGAGDDSITNTNRGAALSLAGSYSYIYAGEGNDYVLNQAYADYSFVDGGAGNDSIDSRAAGSTISGGAGNDSIRNVTSRVSINGGSGNDSIDHGGDSVTIIGGAGNDSIQSFGDKVRACW